MWRFDCEKFTKPSRGFHCNKYTPFYLYIFQGVDAGKRMQRPFWQKFRMDFWHTSPSSPPSLSFVKKPTLIDDYMEVTIPKCPYFQQIKVEWGGSHATDLDVCMHVAGDRAVWRGDDDIGAAPCGRCMLRTGSRWRFHRSPWIPALACASFWNGWVVAIIV